jgi:hypothetical protein
MRPEGQDKVMKMVVSRGYMNSNMGLQTNRISVQIKWLFET